MTKVSFFPYLRSSWLNLSPKLSFDSFSSFRRWQVHGWYWVVAFKNLIWMYVLKMVGSSLPITHLMWNIRQGKYRARWACTDHIILKVQLHAKGVTMLEFIKFHLLEFKSTPSRNSRNWFVGWSVCPSITLSNLGLLVHSISKVKQGQHLQVACGT